MEQQPTLGAEESLLAAFPEALADDVRAALSVVPPGRPCARWFRVSAAGEKLAVPLRLYSPEPPAGWEDGLTAGQSAILGCIYTRHHDGFVRQRWIRRVARLDEPWAAPYVVQLVGEYVPEIMLEILDALPELLLPGSPARALYGRFVAENPAYFAHTERRVISYWNCYWRGTYPYFRTYPGSILIELLRDAGEQYLGRRLRRLSPRVHAQHFTYR